MLLPSLIKVQQFPCTGILAGWVTTLARQGRVGEEQLRQSFEQQAGNRGMDMHLVEVKKATIRGEETEIAIYEGTDQSGDAVRQLITSFPGKGGTAMLMIMGDVNGWDQSAIDDFVESIR